VASTKRLARYLELIVDPTFDDFHAKRGSIRLAFLTSVTIYHSIDRVAEKNLTSVLEANKL
jgi:hypothetical protein